MIGIIDYGLGNLRSVAGAVERVGYVPCVSSDADELQQCNKLILPGVGAFGDGMANLRNRNLIEPLGRMVDGGTPILGICLGFQLLAKSSEEFGYHDGLGWIDARVTRLAPNDPALRVPHVGWNGLTFDASCPLFCGLPVDALFYYVHSFRMEGANGIAVGTCDYGGPFISAIHRDNIFGTQFHPEKSQRHGLSVLKNFLDAG